MFPTKTINVVLLKRQADGLLCKIKDKEILVPFSEMPWDEGEDLIEDQSGDIYVTPRWWSEHVES